jgi:hypothetical protein
MDRKPSEWLTTIFNANGRRGRWISMVQDFHFKILHCLGNKHANVDALNGKPIFISNEEEDF